MIILDKQKIQDILPHRENMLLIDKVCIVDDATVIGEYIVKGTEYFLVGHFPLNPIVPGVILCEMMAQTCCGLAYSYEKKFIPYLIGIDRVRFRHIVVPNDIVIFNCVMLSNKRGIIRVEGNAYVNNKKVLNGRLSFLLSEISGREFN